jgi:glycosyltransferase involved in cell wall biosynthesis
MTADTVGGVWTYALDLARGLHVHGVQVDLATMGAPLSAHQAREAAALDNVVVHESAYKLEWMSDPWGDVERSGDWLLALENDLGPDVVHLNGYAHGSLPWRAPHLVVGHSCVLSWWRAVKGEAAGPEWDLYRFAVQRGLTAADFVVAPTRAMMNELQRCYGPLRSTAVIANGRCPRSYRAGRKEPFILAAGRVWDDAKNIRLLSNLGTGIDWPIYVAGDQRHPDGYHCELPGIRLLGTLSEAELAHYYSKAALYCLPARYEPFGLSIVEAALSGCTLVLGDIPSLRENWEGYAVFVAPNDPDALEWQLRELTGNDERRAALASRALQRAQSFTIERMTNAYLCVYSKVMQNSVPLAVAGD